MNHYFNIDGVWNRGLKFLTGTGGNIFIAANGSISCITGEGYARGERGYAWLVVPRNRLNIHSYLSSGKEHLAPISTGGAANGMPVRAVHD